MKHELLDEVQRLRAAKKRFVLVTDLEDGSQWVVDTDSTDPTGRESADTEVLPRVDEALRRDRSETVERDGRRLFLQVFNPPLRLFLVGAVHITQPLAAMASRTGFEVSIIDPRTAFASEERFPGVEIATEWPDRALTALEPDARSAIVTLTHDPKLDDSALGVALRSPAFYIGSLGSRKTHAARLGRLRAAGFGDNELERIRGPVGLAIGAQSPAEIAVSILAQIVESLRRGGR